MRITDTLEPKSVLSYFADLCAIPHGSGNTKAIASALQKVTASKSIRTR